jgi:hypothetical protein
MSNNEEFDLTRAPVPNSDILQAAIIAKAESMPQYIEFAVGSPAPQKGWRRNMRMALPFAGLCVFALVVSIGPGQWLATEPDASISLATSESLDWQEIMLLQDEWLFSEL